MATKKKWFSVKTLYVVKATGRPKNVDRKFRRSSVMYEERVVLIFAIDHDEAIRKAEREAARYCRETYKNFYGQKVITRYLGSCDSFELFDEVGDGAEIYSSTELLKNEEKKSTYVTRKLGVEHGKLERILRSKFSNAELLKD